MAEETGPAEIGERPAVRGPLGGPVAAGVAVASWGTFESEVFAVLEDGQVWNRYWDGASWHDWKPMGGTFTGTPAASARDADRIDVLAIGVDGVLRHRWWDGAVWVPWRELEGASSDAATVSCSWVGGELRIFIVDAAAMVWCVIRR
ncbi:MAG TPA: hypothetical protein VFW12_01050 [Candidatus Limnocylindria bacterium]|nr:hypothetical protein [Candidatus Limnocylindria bacterium]